jgi:hypothetical protein
VRAEGVPEVHDAGMLVRAHGSSPQESRHDGRDCFRCILCQSA